MEIPLQNSIWFRTNSALLNMRKAGCLMPLEPNCVLNVLILPSSVYYLSLLYVDLVSTSLPLQLALSQTCKFGTIEDKPKLNFSVLDVLFGRDISTDPLKNPSSFQLFLKGPRKPTKVNSCYCVAVTLKYKNGYSTTFQHLYSFKNRIGPRLVSHFEGKVDCTWLTPTA